MKPAPKKRNVIQLKPIRPNAGVAAAYKRALRKILKEIHADIAVEIVAAYAANQSHIAQDINVSEVMKRLFERLTNNWFERLQSVAVDVASRFIDSSRRHTDFSFRKVADDAGMTVNFQMSDRVRQAVDAAVQQNVALIRDLGGQYINGVEQAVYRSIAAGHDMGQLTKVLQHEYGMSQRRAAFIAKDQNNKVKGTIERERRLQNGFRKARWLHTSAGKHPRHTHVLMSGEEYDIEKGMWDPAVKRYIQTGEEPNCHCTSYVEIEF